MLMGALLAIFSSKEEKKAVTLNHGVQKSLILAYDAGGSFMFRMTHK